MSTDLVLIGAGGHAKVVLDTIYLCGKTARVLDRDPLKVGEKILRDEVLLFSLQRISKSDHIHIAIGDNETRCLLASQLSFVSGGFASIVHPLAVVSESAKISEGVFVAARALLGPNASVGQGSIVNHGTIIDHDCSIGCYSHVAPGSVLGGGVSVGDSVLVGSGAVVLPGKRIGDRARIGSGAVVTRDVSGGQTLIGHPARPR